MSLLSVWTARIFIASRKKTAPTRPSFDPTNSKYYVDNYSALMTPPRMSLCTIDGTCNAFWQARSVEGLQPAAPQSVDFKAADGTTTLLGTLLLPKGGPMMANGKAPLIVNPYGGPGVQTVKDSWGAINLFDQILARQGFAVLKVDNRGMANRGRAFAAPDQDTIWARTNSTIRWPR